MITEDYVSLETAKLLKEKGFDEDIDLWYDENGEIFFRHKYDISSDWRVRAQQKVYLCPTLQMAMKWLREVHRLFIQVCIVPHTTVTMEQKYYLFSIYKDRRNRAFRDSFPNTYYSTYEEACESAIKYCLESLI